MIANVVVVAASLMFLAATFVVLVELVVRLQRLDRATARRPRRPTILALESLEVRACPSILTLGGMETITYAQPDGNEVTIRIQGTTGSVSLIEAEGNGNGIFEDGEQLGQVVIADASVDFELIYEADAGEVTMGSIEALGQTLFGVSTEGDARFHLESFAGAQLSANGHLQMDRLVGDVSIHSLAGTAKLEIREDLRGRVLIRDSMYGALQVGGDWTGDLIVGEQFDRGASIQAGAVLGNVTVHGDFQGTALLSGSASGKWLVVGNVLAEGSLVLDTSDPSADVASFSTIRSFFGRIAAPDQVFLDVKGAVGGGAQITGRQASVVVGQSFYGLVSTTDRTYARVSDNVAPTARFISKRECYVAYGSSYYYGARTIAPTSTIRYIPSMMTGTVISWLPFVITKPGLYRLRNHLIYKSASGAAITVQASNVTIDLGGFSIAGTAGSNSRAIGIYAMNRSNVKVINGSVRGFLLGVQLIGRSASNYQVTNIRAENNWYFGLWIEGSRSVITNNQIIDNGGCTLPGYTIPIGLRVIGGGSQVYNNVISGGVRSAVNIEWLGMHVDASPSSHVYDNIIVSKARERKTWGLWINGGAWASEGPTYVLLENNSFVNLEYAATFADTSSGLYWNNVLLDVPLNFTPIIDGRNGGGNVTV